MKKTITLLFIFFSIQSYAQEFQINPSTSSLEIEGTSSLHDWTIKADKVKGEGSMQTENNKIKSIEKFEMEILVKDLKSGKSRMDNNTYTALNEKSHPKITYKLLQVEKIEEVNKQQIIHTTGLLKVAGTERNMPIKVSADGLNLKGSVSFKMTDFNIDPPTAVMGTIRTGDEVTIHFNISLQR